MSAKRYTDGFKIESVKQVTERGFPVSEVAKRLGVTPYSLYYQWRQQFGRCERQLRADADQHDEIRRLKAELRRVTEERDILKKAAAYFAKG